MDGLWGLLPFLFFLVVFFIIPNWRRQQEHTELLKAFSGIQKKRKSRMIALVHRQDPMGILGIPVVKYIDLNDAEDVLDTIARTPDNMPLELILHTPGGLVLSALQIARAIKAHPARTTVFVPHYAMSGGTLIALAADEVVMSEHAVLGPIDPQIGGLPAASLLRVKQEKTINNMDDYSLILADVGEMAIRQLQSSAYELLSGNVSDNAAQAIAEQLSSGRWTHDYPITPAHAGELGLNVSTKIPGDIMMIMSLFPSSLRGSSVKTAEIEQSARNKQSYQKTIPYVPPTMTGRGGMTGYQPGPGAQSFSYGPWKNDGLHQPGPGVDDIRQQQDQEHSTQRKKSWFSRH